MQFLLYVLILLIFSCLLFWLITFVYTSYRGAPYVPINPRRIKLITKFIKKGDRVADLGAGDARVLIEAIKKGASQAEGWELDMAVFALGKIKISQAKKNGSDVSKIKFHFGDFWKADVSNFDVVYIYQMTKYMNPMKEKIIKKLKKGCLIISPDYKIPRMKIYKNLKDISGDLYVYKV